MARYMPGLPFAATAAIAMLSPALALLLLCGLLPAGPATADSLVLSIRAETALGDEAAAEEYRRRLRDEFPRRAETLGASGAGM